MIKSIVWKINKLNGEQAQYDAMYRKGLQIQVTEHLEKIKSLCKKISEHEL